MIALEAQSMNWYALHVRSNHEHMVAQKLEGVGIEAFYPHILAPSRDKRREIEKKFMPGYVFGRFNLAEKTPVVAIDQVVSILGSGRHAIAIPDYEIEAVRLIATAKQAMPSDYIHAGDRVLVTRGPLQGLVGFVTRHKDSLRIVVSVEMLARSISAEVDADSLEVLTAAAAA